MLIFFKCSPGLCPREVRVVKCGPVHTLFQKGGYANSPNLPTLPTLPYNAFWQKKELRRYKLSFCSQRVGICIESCTLVDIGIQHDNDNYMS